MSALSEQALVFCAAGVAAAAVTPIMKRVASAVGAVATPSSDRWHRRTIPLLGGVSIYAGTVAAVFLLGRPDTRVGWVVACGSIMMFVGLLDDFVHLKPSTKVLAQLLVACALQVGGLHSPWLTFPLFDVPLSIFWVVAITNAFNLLDNMDGLCAGIAAIAALAFAASTYQSVPAMAAVATALAGASVGFLIFNYHPASIFMGDAGSLFVGVTLAGLSQTVPHRDTMGVISPLAFPVVLLLIPLFDTAFVTMSRKLSARKASVGGRDHTSHRLVAMGFPESKAVLLLYAFALVGGATAFALARSSFEEASLLTGLLLLGLTLLGVRLARVNVYGQEDFALLRGRSYTPLLVEFTYKRRIFELLLDLSLASFAYYAAYVIRFSDQFHTLYMPLFIESLPIVIACELAGLYAAGAYQGIWRYFTFSDLTTYAKGLALGTLGTLLVIVYLYRFEDYSRGVFLINVLVFGVLVLGARLSFRGLGELASRYGTGGEPVLIYGAGDGGALLARELRGGSRFNYRPVGFLDDDRSKLGRRIHGFPVHGTLDDLEHLLGRYRPTVIVVSTTLDADRMDRLCDICFRSGTQLQVLEFGLRKLTLMELGQTRPALRQVSPAPSPRQGTTEKRPVD